MEKEALTTITDQDRLFLKMACDLATENVTRGGGPFGALIVKDGEVISMGCNSVTRDNDPTAHAVVNAIRRACGMTRNFKLNGCVVYYSCEPCPMCLSALYWAGVSCIYYGNTSTDAHKIYFSDQFNCTEIEKPHNERSNPCIHMEGTDAINASKIWSVKEDKVGY